MICISIGIDAPTCARPIVMEILRRSLECCHRCQALITVVYEGRQECFTLRKMHQQGALQVVVAHAEGGTR